MDSRAASDRSFCSQKSVIFDLTALLKECLDEGVDNIVKGSGREYLAQRLLTCKNQEREDGLETDKVLTARRRRILPESRREIIPSKLICRSSSRPVSGRLPPRKWTTDSGVAL